MNKEIKTILFASLIAAMILPFSGMNFATAQTATDTEEKPTTEDKLSKVQELITELETQTTQKFEATNDVVLDRLNIIEELLNLRIYTETINSNDFTEKYTSYLLSQLDETYNESDIQKIIQVDSVNPQVHKTDPLTSTFLTLSQKKFDCEEIRYEYGFNYGTVTSNNLDDSFLYGVQNYPSTIGVMENNWCNDYDFEDGYLRFQPVAMSGQCVMGFHNVNDIQSGFCWKFGLGSPVVITANASYENNHDYSVTEGWDFIWVGQ